MFWKKPKEGVQPEWLIVGLGNPGGEYRGTRHNVGFEVVDRLSEKHKIKFDRSKHRARLGVGLIDGHPVVLVKPMTYMNLSGQSVAPLAREYSLPPSRVLVISDDKDLPVGKVRLKPKGSSGGHNGHKSIMASLQTAEYPRLKIGIGSGERGAAIDHVLGAFTQQERERVNDTLQIAVRACELVIGGSLEAAMSETNEGGLV